MNLSADCNLRSCKNEYRWLNWWKPSSISCSCHQHISSPTSITNIDVTFLVICDLLLSQSYNKLSIYDIILNSDVNMTHNLWVIKMTQAVGTLCNHQVLVLNIYRCCSGTQYVIRVLLFKGIFKKNHYDRINLPEFEFRSTKGRSLFITHL